jgi:hypothetical protein
MQDMNSLTHTKYSVAQVVGYIKGKSEESIKKYIREQEVENKRLDQLELFKEN